MFDDLDDDMDSLDIEECYVAVRDYTKQDIDELDMFEGQVVCVIDDTDKGEDLVCPRVAATKQPVFYYTKKNVLQVPKAQESYSM